MITNGQDVGKLYFGDKELYEAYFGNVCVYGQDIVANLNTEKINISLQTDATCFITSNRCESLIDANFRLWLYANNNQVNKYTVQLFYKSLKWNLSNANYLTPVHIKKIPSTFTLELTYYVQPYLFEYESNEFVASTPEELSEKLQNFTIVTKESDVVTKKNLGFIYTYCFNDSWWSNGTNGPSLTSTQSTGLCNKNDTTVDLYSRWIKVIKENITYSGQILYNFSTRDSNASILSARIYTINNDKLTSQDVTSQIKGGDVWNGVKSWNFYYRPSTGTKYFMFNVEYSSNSDKNELILHKYI